MIQSLKPPKNNWFLHWIDLEEPLPVRADWFLPTLVIISDESGTPIAPPEVMEELDQPRIENLLYKIFDKLGTPDRLLVSASEEWDREAWKIFSADSKVDVRFQTSDNKSSDEFHSLTKTFVMHIERNADALPHAREIAPGLVRTALRVRSPSKKIALLRFALARDVDCISARIELADLEFQEGNWKSCLTAYEEIVRRETARWLSRRVQWWLDKETRPFLRGLYGKAMTQWHLGRYAAAARTLEELLAYNFIDNQGARFLIPMLHLLAEAPERATLFFSRYEENYPQDYPEPAFLFGWALCQSLEGMEQDARTKYSQGILKNIYMAPMLLEQDEPPRGLWLPNDRAEPNYAAEFIDSYAMLWDREPGALRLLREVYQELLPQIEKIILHRQKMADFQDQHYEPDYKRIWEKLIAEDEHLTTY